MKKVPLLLILTTISLASFAQTIVPKLGLTLSQMTDPNESYFNVKSIIGFNAGVGLQYDFNETFSIQPELQFIQKGVRHVNESIMDIPAGRYLYREDTKITIHYLELPVLAKISWGSGNTKFFVNAGPSIGIGLGGRMKVEVFSTDPFTSFTYKFESKVKFDDDAPRFDDSLNYDNRLDFGLQFGGGVVIAKSIVIDIRYGLGVSKANDKQEWIENDDAKCKNRVFQFTVGMPISLKKK
ncbi:MAG: porin family protein [Bacteroidota bacterium]